MADDNKATDGQGKEGTTGADAGKTGTGTASSAAAAATTPTFKFVDNDGKFVEGWKNNLPEEYRDEKCLDVLADLPTMTKNYVYTQKMRGKKTVAVPTETSPQTDWDAYYEAIGRPKAKEDYKADKPKDLPDELWDKELVNQIREEGWKAGFTPKQVDTVLGLYAGYQKRLAEADATAMAAEKADAETALKKEWGDAYDERMHLANAFISKTTDEASGQRQAILELAGNNPLFIRWCADWGLKTSEAKGIDTSQLRKTPGAALARIRELQATPGYIKGELKKTDPLRHDQITRELAELHKEAYPEGR